MEPPDGEQTSDRNADAHNHRKWRAVAFTLVVLCLLVLAVFAALPNSRQPHTTKTTSSTTSSHAKTTKEKTPDAVHGEFATEPTWVQDFTKMPNGPFNVAGWHQDTNPEVPGYNDEAQGYTDNDPSNIFIENGKLVIAARRQQYTYPDDTSGKTYNYTSARIDTRNSFTFEYGKVEARIKMPKGRGTWPAWWFMSATQTYTSRLNPTASDWAKERFYMHDGELDAAESYGQLPSAVEGTLYTFNKTYEQTAPVSDATDVFHTYGVAVTPNKVVWTVDGQPFQTVQKPSDSPDDWPFGGGNRFYMILNLAMGGSGGGSVIDDSSSATWRMEVESLKYYPYQGM